MCVQLQEKLKATELKVENDAKLIKNLNFLVEEEKKGMSDLQISTDKTIEELNGQYKETKGQLMVAEKLNVDYKQDLEQKRESIVSLTAQLEVCNANLQSSKQLYENKIEYIIFN